MDHFVDSKIEPRFIFDSLIFYSKIIDFKQSKQMTKAQISHFTKYLSDQKNISDIKKANNDLLLIYYKKGSLIKQDNATLREFFSFISNYNQELKTEFLHVLYNLIELVYQNKLFGNEQNHILLKKLCECSNINKNYVESNLFNYYKFFLSFALGNYKECNDIGLNSIIDNNDSSIQKDDKDFYDYLNLRMNIIFWRINHLSNEKTNQANQEKLSLTQVIYGQLKLNNIYNGTKVGLCLSDIFLNNFSYNEAYLLLIEMYYNVKNEISKGVSMKSPQELFFQILSRLAYVSVFLGFQIEIIKMVKKFEKKYLILDIYQSFLSSQMKSKYGYCLAILHMIIGKSTFSKEEITDMIKDYRKEDRTQNFSIINNYLLNQSDNGLKEEFNKQLLISIMFLKKSKISNELLFAWFNIYNSIYIASHVLAEDDDTNSNQANKNEINRKIKEDAELILSSARHLIQNDKLNPLFQLVYVRISFIRVAFFKLYSAFNDNNKSSFAHEIAIVEGMMKDLIGTEPLTKKEYMLIIKLKGDFAYKNAKYEEAVACYKEALINLTTSKQKALIHFNLGLAYYFLKDIFETRRYLNLSLNEYQKLIQKNSKNNSDQCFVFQKKIEIVDQIINHFLMTDSKAD